MKRVIARPGQCVHIETPLGIVNIRCGLTDHRGRSVDSVEIIPDHYEGEPRVKRYGLSNTRLVQLKGRKS